MFRLSQQRKAADIDAAKVTAAATKGKAWADLKAEEKDKLLKALCEKAGLWKDK